MSVPAGVPIGGPFELIDENRHRITDADYRGRWMLVFFDYTNCPDECPLTLQKMATTLQDLGPLADRIAPLFITVDPVRDTPERLASYLENFDTRIIGLTGSGDQVAAVATAYRVLLRAWQDRGVGRRPRQPLDLSLLDGPEWKAECALLPGRHAREADGCLAHAPVVAAASGSVRSGRVRSAMMHEMGSMMWGMGLVWLIGIVVLVLAGAGRRSPCEISLLQVVRLPVR